MVTTTRKVWAVTIFLILLLIGVSVYELIRFYDISIDRAYEKANLSVHLVSEWIAESLTKVEFQLEDLSSQVLHLSGGSRLQVTSFQDRVNQHLWEQVEQDPNLLFLGVNDQDCILVYSSIDSLLGDSAEELKREYCTLARQEPLDELKISNAFLSSTGSMNVSVTYPLLTGDDAFLGFSLAGMDLSFFQRWLHRIDDPSVTITIIDRNKRIIARKPENEMIGTIVTFDAVDQFMSSDRRNGTFKLLSPLDAVERLWSIRKIRSLPFAVAVGYSTEQALQSWYEKLWLYVAGTVVVSLAMAFIAMKYLANVRLVKEMQIAMDEVKTLSGLLPICAHCKKIRDDKGYWNQLESYLHDHSGAEFSHGICPECMEKLYGNEEWYAKYRKKKSTDPEST